MGVRRPDHDRARGRMVDEQIAGRDVTDQAVLSAMRRVPRERFVQERDQSAAYADRPRRIGYGQTISQPYVVAWMSEAARLEPSDRVLEVGTGSGYGAAVLGCLAEEVWTVERIPELADTARRRLAELGYENVHVVDGDGSLGSPEHAPFDAIVVTAAGPRLPPALLDQLVEGGRLVMPVEAGQGIQHLVLAVRHGDDHDEWELGAVRFVPLIGRQAWSDADV